VLNLLSPAPSSLGEAVYAAAAGDRRLKSALALSALQAAIG
jgi:hypothetical protein